MLGINICEEVEGREEEVQLERGPERASTQGKVLGYTLSPEYLIGSFYLHPTHPVDTGAWGLTGLGRTDFLQLGQTEGIES